MARISYLTGKASWRPDGTVGWSRATVNLPLRQGAQVWLAPGSRMELQFDDGTAVDLGSGAVATLQTLYSDSQGEFTEVKLSAGIASWRLRSQYSIYQVDTPFDSVKSVGPSTLRIDVKPQADSLAVRSGSATLTSDGKDTRVPAGDYVVLRGPNDPVDLRRLSNEDAWDRFSDNRDAVLADPPAHVPADIGMVAGGLDRHGHWHFEAGYGWVWAPIVGPTWRPYYLGHWVWVDPFGWTWVSDDPWGWAPYHYGTWAHFGFGWGWCPGPAVQYWTPAAVDFVSSDGYVMWAPLAPAEVAYPAFSVGFRTGNWWFDFSIGGCGVYEPFGPAICDPVAYPAHCFEPGWRRHGWDPAVWGAGRYAPDRFRFVPRNATFGAVGVSAAGFAGRGTYAVVGRNARPLFAHRAQAVASRAAFSGPVGVRPTRTSFTPGRAVAAHVRPSALSRPLYRAPLSGRVARASGAFGPRTYGARATAFNRARQSTSFGNRAGAAHVPHGVAAARRSLAFRGRNSTSMIRTTARGARTMGHTASASRGRANTSMRTRSTRNLRARRGRSAQGVGRGRQATRAPGRTRGQKSVGRVRSGANGRRASVGGGQRRSFGGRSRSSDGERSRAFGGGHRSFGGRSGSSGVGRSFGPRGGASGGRHGGGSGGPGGGGRRGGH